MDQFQTLSLLQMALNTNAIFTVATFFILWVAFRFAGKMREGESTMLGRVLITVFGLMIVWTGLLVGASRNLSFNAAASGLESNQSIWPNFKCASRGFLNYSPSFFCNYHPAIQFIQRYSKPHFLVGCNHHAFVCNLDACDIQEIQLTRVSEFLCKRSNGR